MDLSFPLVAGNWRGALSYLREQELIGAGRTNHVVAALMDKLDSYDVAFQAAVADDARTDEKDDEVMIAPPANPTPEPPLIKPQPIRKPTAQEAASKQRLRELVERGKAKEAE